MERQHIAGEMDTIDPRVITESYEDCEDDVPPRRLFTREEFERAGELGLFRPDERLELIEGEIISHMAPMMSPHASAVQFAQDNLLDVFRRGYVVRVQLPLALGEHRETHPDVAIVTGKSKDFVASHPTTAVLVVEAADSTLMLDRQIKGALYARAGIADYWIINVKDRMLEVYREPSVTPSGSHYYRSIMRLTEGDTISPLAAPDSAIAVADLLP
jgi:Uma2 family endonuclease